AFGAVGIVDKPKKQLRFGRDLEIAQGKEVGVIVAIAGHRHVYPCDRMLYVRHDKVGQLDGFAKIQRLDEVLRVQVAVTQVESQLDVVGNCVSQLPKRRDEGLLHSRKSRHLGVAAVPHQHLDTHVPLYSQVVMRNGGADTFHLAEHRDGVRRENLGHIFRNNKSTDDRERCRQAYLKTCGGLQLACLPGLDEVL